MGLYYAAVDNDEKEYFEPPEHFANKFPGLCHPHNPFPGMIVMMNARGSDFEIENDGHWNCYYDKGYKNITDEVYKDFLELWPWAKEFYDKDFDYGIPKDSQPLET